MRIAGIDPGLSGGVAILGTWVALYDTPTATVKKAKGFKRVYLPAMMVSLLADVEHVFLENVHAMPKEGVVSVFSMGRGMGLWEGIIAALGLPHTLVEPVIWKRAMVGIGKDKEASRLRAQQLFPTVSGQLNLKKHHGRAEALLIAEFGRRHFLDPSFGPLDTVSKGLARRMENER